MRRQAIDLGARSGPSSPGRGSATPRPCVGASAPARRRRAGAAAVAAAAASPPSLPPPHAATASNTRPTASSAAAGADDAFARQLHFLPFCPPSLPESRCTELADRRGTQSRMPRAKNAISAAICRSERATRVRRPRASVDEASSDRRVRASSETLCGSRKRTQAGPRSRGRLRRRLGARDSRVRGGRSEQRRERALGGVDAARVALGPALQLIGPDAGRR